MLTNGVIVDFYVQDTTKQHFEPDVVVLACRNPEFQEMLDGFSRPAVPLIKEIDGSAARQFLVDYWIITLKQLKALERQYDLSPFVGLFYERLSLLRAWHMKYLGQDIPARPTLHMLGVLHKGLGNKLNAQQQQIMGLPSRTPEETAQAIEAIRAEMSAVGRWLAENHQFDYPQQLEDVVAQVWREHKESAIQR